MHHYSKKLVYFSLISNVELKLCIYKKLALISLAYMAQDNWLVNSICALWIKACVKCVICAQIITNSSYSQLTT